MIPLTGAKLDGWLDVVRAVADAGADAIEIGILNRPGSAEALFSDPVMDGRITQEASRWASRSGPPAALR